MVFRKRDVSSSGSSDSASAATDHSYKPLPLKQRTSSSTDRRDFTSNTWISLLELIKFREYLIPVNHFSIWRRHNAWAFEDGKDLRSYIGNRYASNMVFMSLLLSTEFGVLFNSSEICGNVRDDLVEAHWGTVSFWAGLFIIISALFTILSLISTFTFTAMISAIDERNAHCILRSSIGQYTTELPGRLIVGSIYTFLISFMLFFFLLLPLGIFSIFLLLGTIFLFVHVVSVFSSFGRIIMHTGAMGKGKIFSSEYEELLVPDSLHSHLLSKARSNLKHKISIRRQYRTRQKEIDRFLLDTEYYDHLSGTTKPYLGFRIQNATNASDGNRLRADSKVRFADEETGFLNNHKTVIEGKIDDVAGSARHHFRSLTPMSDISDHYSQSVGQNQTTRSTVEGDFGGLSSLAAPPKKFFANSDRGREISDLSAVNTMQNVSNSSLEQWLQGSSSHSVTNSLRDSTTNRQTKTFDGEVEDEKKDVESLRLPPVVPPPLASVSSTFMPKSINRKPKSLDTTFDREDGESTTMEYLDTGSLRLQRANERDMSEDERFLFDYGEFASDSPEMKKKTRVGYGTNNNNHLKETDNDGKKKDGSDAIDSPPESERTKLLK